MSYTLVSSYDTVQVLSSTTAIDVLYCTISTGRHQALVQYAVPKANFDIDQGQATLDLFATAVDDLMDASFVIGATSSQTVDANGLIEDDVVFTIQYVPSTPTAGSITTTVPLPANVVGLDPSLQKLLPGGTAFDQLLAAYNRLETMASG